MDLCLLCLELWTDVDERIKVGTPLWLEMNIEEIVEKHIWPLKSLKSTSSWLCKTCWQVLNEFHNFYERIKDVHSVFTSSKLKMELEEISKNENEINTNMENPLQQNLMETMENDETELSSNDIRPKEEEIYPMEVKIEIYKKDLLEIPEEKSLTLKRSSRLRKGNDPLEKIILREKRSTTKKNKNKMCPKEKSTLRETLIKSKSIKEDETMEISNMEYSQNDSYSDNHTDSFENSNDFKISNFKAKEHDSFVAENFKIICGICQLPMSTFYEVSAHSAKEHKQRGYVKCCNKKFYRRIILVEHIRWHLDPERFKCRECGKILADRRCLQVHERLHAEQKRNHTCDICGKGFARPVTLQRHKYTHIPDEERKEPCSQCDKKFANKNLLMEHVRSVHLHSYSVVCDICGKEIRSKAVFQRHMLQHAGLQTTVSCDICGLKLSDKRRLKVHKQTQHSQDTKKEYKCPICSKISASRGALKQHIQYNHETGYDFKCTVCDKAFKRACTLKEHMATHTGTVLYTCPYCPKTFNSNANMYTHRKKAHPQKWEEAFREKYSGNLPPKLQKLPLPKEEGEKSREEGNLFV